MTGSEDLIDQAYFPFIRPLGNLVVLCAQAEAALLAFVAELMRRDEPTAQAVLKKKDAHRSLNWCNKNPTFRTSSAPSLFMGSSITIRIASVEIGMFMTNGTSACSRTSACRERGVCRARKTHNPFGTIRLRMTFGGWLRVFVDTNSYSPTRPTCCDSAGPVALRELPAKQHGAIPVASS